MSAASLRGVGRGHQFLVPARRRPSSAHGADGAAPRPDRPRHRRPQHGRRGRARPLRAQGSARGRRAAAREAARRLRTRRIRLRGASAHRQDARVARRAAAHGVRFQARRRSAPRLRRRHAGHRRVSRRPRRLGPAVPASQHRQAPGQEERMHPSSRRSSRRPVRAFADRHAAAAARWAAEPPRPPGERRARRGLARRRHASPRRRPAPAGASQGRRRRRRRAAPRRQRRALRRARRPRPAGHPHLHPREGDDRPRRPQARGQCRALPQAAGRDGAPVPRCAGRRRRDAAPSRAHRFLARPAQIRVSRRARAARLGGRRLARGGDLAPGGHALSGRHSRSRGGAARGRARPHQAPRIRALLPHHPRHRPGRRGQGHSLPGARLGRQFRRLLRARHHGGRPGRERPAVRALRLHRAARAARYRRRFRA